MNQEPLKLPDLTLPSTLGDFPLRAPRQEKMLLYFYPKDNTAGCTKEATQFAEAFSAFRRKKIMIVGVSRDSVASHQRFQAKYELPFVLIADTEEKLCHHFDVIKDKTMYGKKVRGIERSTFLIGTDHRVIHAWRKVKADGHAQEVLAWVKTNI
jgi:Peroxiredoxin